MDKSLAVEIREVERILNNSLEGGKLIPGRSVIEQICMVSIVGEIARKQHDSKRFLSIYNDYVRPMYMYILWRNDFQEMDRFAEYFALSESVAIEIVERGKDVINSLASIEKSAA